MANRTHALASGTLLTDSAEQMLWQSLTIVQQTYGADCVQSTEYLDSIAWIKMSKGDLDQAAMLYCQSVKIKARQFGEQHVSVACATRNLADLYYRQGNYEQAERLAKKALCVFAKALGPKSEQTQAVLQKLIGLFNWQGRYEEATELQGKLEREDCGICKICDRELSGGDCLWCTGTSRLVKSFCQFDLLTN